MTLPSSTHPRQEDVQRLIDQRRFERLCEARAMIWRILDREKLSIEVNAFELAAQKIADTFNFLDRDFAQRALDDGS